MHTNTPTRTGAIGWIALGVIVGIILVVVGLFNMVF